MPESLLTILKFLLLALVYLFFFRVLRAVWAEVASPREAPAPAPSRPARDRSAPGARTTPARLKVVDPPAMRGQAFDLGEELTLGRAAGCQIRIEDSYASQLHARVFRRDGQFFVEDLGSTNGTYLNRRGTSNKEKVAGALPLGTGDRLMIGQTVLEVGR